MAGPPPSAQAFAAAWSTLTGGTAITRLEERLHRLGELVVPSVPGRPAIATSDHQDLLLAWLGAFAEELHSTYGDPETVVDSRQSPGASLWLVDEPVSIAAATPVLAGMARIGPVYTPPQ